MFKGTVQPHWIWMRVIPVPLDKPWKGHQPLHVFDFLFSDLNIWKDFKVLSRFIQKWIQPPACSDHGLYRILSSFGVAQFYLLKKSTKGLHYFGLDCGMLKFFWYSTHEPWSKEQLLTFRHFWSTSRKRSRFVPIETVIPTSMRLDSFLYEAAQNFEVFSKIQK